MIIRETIDDLLNAKEGENYQFKEWKTKDDLKETAKICCALANCGGGKLVLGVTDKRPRKVVGSTAFPQPERTRVDLMNKLCVRVDFYIYDNENKRVLVFDVASRPIGLPIQTESGAWWYKGDSLIIMPEEVRRAIYAESGHDFSGDVCPGLNLDHLDDEAIENFRNLWIEHTKNKRLATLSKEQLLRDCGALAEAGLTYAALVLFGKPNVVARQLPQAEIIFEYRSSQAAGPAAQREDFCEGFFVRSYDRIWELVNLRNDNQHYQNRFAIHPVPTFNEKVVREAVLNAVTHRDYQLGGSIFVRQYNRRIVIESPGGFPTGIAVENILDRQSPRNHHIAKIFQLCGLVERSGQGMNLIYELSVKEAKPLPDFTGSDAFSVKLTLDGQVIHTNMLAMLKKTDEKLIDEMTTDDYVLLSMLFQKRDDVGISHEKFTNLLKLGIVRKTELGIELVEGNLIVVVDENDIL
ncbi:MAG: putative DNA binding domain-containing protein [Clostridiales bacterium]|jgi:ATP-dependent DNA helicase RecG|nr:putative DNA binding domain-containing protein [Clostridiales bacterium]